MASREPIAIVGMACRFPGGASDLDRFWKLLETKTDAICEVPRGRWDSRKFYSPNPRKAGKAYVNHAGFLQEPIDEFDPLFFRMSPRETEGLDPQQRILLEVTWESFEDAGVQKSQLEGSKTGVFIGGFCIDANHLYMSALNREIIDSHTATSSSMSLLANRVSYAFDLQGPSVTMDTACSSSLVATHMACLSLWNGECDLAVAGGSSVMLRPETPITMSKGQFLSKDGRCKTFDKSADGYARAEGAGVVILKPLSRALEDNDYVYAQILASGINQDGRTSGITLPNVESQKALMRQVYAIADIKPRDIGYIEAHGTGTQAGDKTEAAALHDVLADGRVNGDKVVVGSVKTNIGHLEAAAGIAGVIKAALCLDRKTLVPNLHFNEPNPEIPFHANCLEIPTSAKQWDITGDRPRLAAINSFGYGGTNAHVLLQEAPAPRSVNGRTGAGGERLVCLSANGEAALHESTRKYVNWIRRSGDAIAFDDLVYSMNMRRSHLDNRMIVRAGSTADLETKLRAFLKNGSCEGIEHGHIDPGRVVFVYTGMGPQWWGMGRRLFADEKVFADKVEECDALFREIAGWSILDEMMKDEAASRIAETAIAQPANFVLQVALTELWKHWGVVPDAVVGHSVGEVAAAHVSGALDLRDALTVSYHRSRLQATLAGSGTMLAVGLGEDEAVARLAKFGSDSEQASIAAINSPASVTVAGGRETLEAIAGALEKEGTFARFLAVEIPYHSHKMDPIKDELHAALAHIAPRRNEVPLYSTVTGGLIQGVTLNGGYWWQNVRLPVRFADATSTIARDGFRHFVEVGPHPVLRPSINECLSKAGKKGYTIQSLNRKAEDERAAMLASLCTLYTHGVEIDLARWCPAGARYVKLPSYAWQKDKYWRESEASRQDRLGNPGPAWFNTDLHLFHPAWEVELNPLFFPYVEDHVVQGNVVFPGAAYVEAGLELCRKQTGKDSCVLENVSFLNMLALVEDKVQNIQTHYDEGSRYYSIASGTKGDKDHWTLHAKGRIVPQEVGSIMRNRDLEGLKARCGEALDVEKQYAVLAANGL
ncbi:MAG: type I polyketide synthase, partial [Candidatus Hydrogenedentes bacterium]|nr:type I polyketide synthase [Candidatus Hydrogenedentota bacterium]